MRLRATLQGAPTVQLEKRTQGGTCHPSNESVCGGSSKEGWWPLSRVLPQVGLQVGLLHKALGAVGTLEGTITRVYAFVTLKQRVVECRVAAEATLPHATPNR